jgi:D-glycero-D-manno-heptose 1,7-bisphosphate phosphatase
LLRQRQYYGILIKIIYFGDHPFVKLRPAIFLDRDGVLNQAIVKEGKPFAPRQLEDFHLFSEAPGIISEFKQAGFLVIVVTNQPDVGNGFVAKSVIEAMHMQLTDTLVLDAIKVCYHAQGAGCDCRKPKPGMLMEAAQEWGIELNQSTMVGDRASDILAGRAAGCRTILIDYAYAEPCVKADLTVGSLQAAASAILGTL